MLLVWGRRAQALAHSEARPFEDSGVAEEREDEVCRDEERVGSNASWAASRSGRISPRVWASWIAVLIACIQPVTNSAMRSAEIARDAHGFLLTGEEIPDNHHWQLERRPLTLETSMPGVLAAGDVRHASVKRVASAVGEGAIAVQLVHNLLTDDPSTKPTAERAGGQHGRTAQQQRREPVSRR